MKSAAEAYSRNPFGGPVPAGMQLCAVKDAEQTNNVFNKLIEASVKSGKQEAPGVPIERTRSEEQAPVIRLVEALLKEALIREASDIHLQPHEDGLRVRLRVDGELQDVLTLPRPLTNVIISRLKIMADLDICERRMPQDGCIRFRKSGSPAEDGADLRISTVPSVFGENLVMRILRRDQFGNKLDEVGLPPRDLLLLRRAIERPDGAVLVTGPTGSGKTTTLYAALTELNSPDISIFTAEDPVEGTMRGVTQIQANAAVGLTFASILRSLLRQDPDVIMIGEIRDKETVEIATKAALTGHLVLSTLHTNDTASTVERMLNMGVEPYLISSAVNLIVAQRLLRRLCESCKQECPLTPEVTARIGISPAALKEARTFRPAGCAKCSRTGYRGRIPIFETMPLTALLKDRILRGTNNSQLKVLARIEGMTTLREAAMSLVLSGITSLDEVFGKTNEDEHNELVEQKRRAHNCGKGVPAQ